MDFYVVCTSQQELYLKQFKRDFEFCLSVLFAFKGHSPLACSNLYILDLVFCWTLLRVAQFLKNTLIFFFFFLTSIEAVVRFMINV